MQMNIQETVVNAVEGLREFLAAVGFDKWYGMLVAIVSSLASELLFVLVMQIGKGKHDNRHYGQRTQHFEQQEREKDGIGIILLKLLLYVLVYAAFLAVSVLAYVVTQNIRLGTSGIWGNFLKTGKLFWNEYLEIMIVVPIVIKVLNLADKGRSQALRSFTILVLILIMLFSPAMITYPRGSRQVIEPLLLAQLRQAPFPYVTRFYDADHFWNSFGYVRPEDDETEQNDLAGKPLPTGETENMDFDALMQAADICSDWDDEELLKVYVDAAYEVYQNGQYGDSFYVGLMWYFKGKCEESADFYCKGGEVYERISQYMNAALCYVRAYGIDWTPTYADKTIECYFQYVEEVETVPQRRINTIAKLLVLMQGHYEDDIPHLDDLCDMYPDNLAVQIVGIMRHIKEGMVSADDMQAMERLELMLQYQNCPKLMLAKQYYGLIYGIEPDVDDMYTWYQQESALFEADDILNLAWFLYLNGEYTRAYKLATDVALGGDTPKDAYPLIVEIYLQDAGALPALNGEELAADLTEAVRGVMSWYSEDSQLRFRLTELLLSNRLGLELDLNEVTGGVRKLFDGDTFTEGLIQATLDYEEGRYQDCVERCERILDIEVSSQDLHKVLFLKTDALLEMAAQTGDSEERAQLLARAEEAMKAVQEDVEDDYIECLNRLLVIYSDMADRDSERMAVNDILQAFD